MKKLKTILQSRYLFKILCIIFIAYGFLMINFFPFQSKYQGTEESITGIVTKYKIDGNQLTMYVKEKETIVVTYYFETNQEKKKYQMNLELGMLLK